MASERNYGKTMVLTGAGASAALGLPTMQAFRTHIEEAGSPVAEMAARMNRWQGYDNAEQTYNCLELYIDAAERASDGDANLQVAKGGPGSEVFSTALPATHATGSFRSLVPAVACAETTPSAPSKTVHHSRSRAHCLLPRWTAEAMRAKDGNATSRCSESRLRLLGGVR